MQIFDLNPIEVKNLNSLPKLFTRDVKTHHVKKIKDSVKKHGVLRDIVVAKLPFIGDGLYIIDGQSLVKACTDLNLGVSAKVVKIDGMQHLVELMSTVNSATKNWKVSNYIDAWATIKMPDYVYLKKVESESGLHGSALLYFYTSFNKYSDVLSNVKEGTLTIDKNRGDNFLSAYKKYVACGLYSSSSSATGLARIMDKLGITGFDEKLCEIIKSNLSIYSQRLSLMELAFYFSIHTKNKF